MKHRKLFQAHETTYSCPDYCDLSCPDFISKCDHPFPVFSFPPPPPSSFYPLKVHHPISSYTIAFISIAGFFFILLTYYLLAFRPHNPSTPTDHREPSRQNDDTDHDDEFLDTNRTARSAITAVGLQQSVVNSIRVCNYKKKDGLVEESECSVCLGEFEEDERVRVLPKCNHAFHVRCIDTWFKSHSNCPLCRANINVASADGLIISSDFASERNGETTEVENDEVNGVRNGGVCENGEGSGEEGSTMGSLQPVLMESSSSATMNKTLPGH